MAKKENGARKKGTFGAHSFAVAKKYVFPNPRRSMILIGVVLSLGVLAYLLVDFFYFKTSVTSSGPLSSFHATFEKDCAACHVRFKAVTNENCSTCHEKTGDELGVYSFAAHEVYRSGDFGRLDSSMHETACSDCHQEHQGRGAALTQVSNMHCVRCHDHAPFEKKHPQFDFAAMPAADDSTLRFPHIRHVKEVMKRQKLIDVERSCLYCHHPQPDGKRFEPIEFDAHCESCHLAPTQQTPPLKIKSAEAPLSPGVETLEAIRRKRGPGYAWAFQTSPNEFIIKPGNRIVKSPIRHEDPWIMENLKMVQSQLYPNFGLAELLKTTNAISTPNAKSKTAAMYQEAIQTLRSYSAGLRGRPEPEVQKELARIDSLLKKTERKLRNHSMAAADLKLFMPRAAANPSLTSQQIDDLNLFVNDLTKPCQQCHTVANASIVRVQKDQQVLMRAEFDHRAHIIHRRCLDCHTEIPIMQSTADSLGLKKMIDRSSIQNIPKVGTCVECHNASESSNRCITCHYFHPNKTNRSSLLLYLD